MRILLIDGQGGKMGKELADAILTRFPQVELIAVGTNSLATATMLKSGVRQAATGENAVVINSREADLIVGPIGMVIADSMLGEVTPRMALAVARSRAVKIMIPVSRCRNLVAGTGRMSFGELLADAMNRIEACISAVDGTDPV